jgi:hypothetical protein
MFFRTRASLAARLVANAPPKRAVRLVHRSRWSFSGGHA